MTQHERQDAMDRGVSDDRSPLEIEHEIERTRERMSGNIDELGDRLSPENLKQQAKEAISEKAQDMVASVGDQARQTGSRALDFITQNPLPVAAVGLGAIWLFTLRRGDRSQVSGDRMARFSYTGPERREANGRPGLGRRLADQAGSMRHAVSDAVSDAGEKAGELKERVQERAGELGGQARERARAARGGLKHMMQDSPLAIAVGAAVVGLALGLLLPETEPERRAMGATRDEIADRVGQAASRVKEVAADAGRELQETVREQVSEHAPQVKDALKDVAETVKGQLKESAGRATEEAKQEIRKSPSTTRGAQGAG
jgi:ElaB/YqjD/DUF883 family membrane-anchored ribosome-binding protein